MHLTAVLGGSDIAWSLCASGSAGVMVLGASATLRR